MAQTAQADVLSQLASRVMSLACEARPPSELARLLGFRVTVADEPQPGSVRHDGEWLIRVSSALHAAEREWVVAHEIGEILLASAPPRERESLADAFAALLTVPHERLARFHTLESLDGWAVRACCPYASPRALAGRVASHLGVNCRVKRLGPDRSRGSVSSATEEACACLDPATGVVAFADPLSGQHILWWRRKAR